MSITVGGLQLTITDSNRNEITSNPNFQIRELSIIEAALQIPRFECKFDSTYLMYGSDFLEGQLSLKGNNMDSRLYDLTVLSFSPGRVTGYLIDPDHIFERRSNYLADELGASIDKLKIRRNSIEGCDEISAPNTFYQYNETDLECCTRLLNMTGQDTIWCICADKIRVFPRVPESNDIKKISIGDGYFINFDRKRVSPTNFEPLSGETDRYNLNYGRYSVPVPRLSTYSRDAVASAIQKRQERGGWVNCSVTKVYNDNPGLEIGDSVHFSDWDESPLEYPDFVVTSVSINFDRMNVQWSVEFTNNEGWGQIEE